MKFELRKKNWSLELWHAGEKISGACSVTVNNFQEAFLTIKIGLNEVALIGSAEEDAGMLANFPDGLPNPKKD